MLRVVQGADVRGWLGDLGPSCLCGKGQPQPAGRDPTGQQGSSSGQSSPLTALFFTALCLKILLWGTLTQLWIEKYFLGRYEHCLWMLKNEYAKTADKFYLLA